MSKLLELALRCEKVEGPDRELDGEIDRLVNSRPKNGDYDAAENAIWQVKDGWSGLLVRSDGFARGSFCALAYTASLDAAMTLVPEGWHDSIYGLGVMAADLCCVHLEPPEYDGPGERSEAATRPLALCAAALRARATQEQPE